MLYNDAYRKILGTRKHPQAMGAAGETMWPEIWHIIGPMLNGVLERAEATWSDDLLLTLERDGYPEECYFTFSYSPIRDESGGVGGVFTAVHETTEKVLGERRLGTLRELAANGSKARTVDEACDTAIATLAKNQADIPFAYLFLLDEASGEVRFMRRMPEAAPFPQEMQASLGSDRLGSWPLRKVIESGAPLEVDNVSDRFGELPRGPWPFPPEQAMVLPLRAPGQETLAGVLVTGLTSGRKLDDDDRSFLELVAEHTATAISGAKAYEAERARAEALAEIDRAKTTFFSNVSHEFRTPLTLMLGPLENVLETAGSTLPADQLEELKTAQRNSIRLLRLVNTLLDFSRIEAGRADSNYEPTDLARLTMELASSFQSAIDAAGLRLELDCPPLPEPVFVDRDMWEKIVLNLISNAFKFTFSGEIAVTLRALVGEVKLSVRDTGIGIPAEELPRLFERFHRVEGARGRTHEGTGIGLAFTQELVKLHGGSIDVQSGSGQGSIFTVSLPLGHEHLPKDRLRSGLLSSKPANTRNAFLVEAMSWLSGSEIVEGKIEFHTEAASSGSTRQRPKVVLADDNADLRGYVGRLLEPRFEVVCCRDGESALTAIQRELPDLVLSDVMMPGLDGIGLLRAVRANPKTAAIPFILLSARVGEEATRDGLEAGADDYLVKPFTATELLARVSSHIRLAHLRRSAQSELRRKVEELETLLNVIPVGIGIAEDPECRHIRMNRAFSEMLGIGLDSNASKTAPGGERPATFEVRTPLGEAVADRDLPMQIAARTGIAVQDLELEVLRDDGCSLRLLEYAAPLLDEEGQCRGSVGAFVDITAMKQADELLRAERESLTELLLAAPAGICVLKGPTHVFQLANAQYLQLIGKTDANQIIGKSVQEVLPEVELQGYIRLLDQVYSTGEAFVGNEMHLTLGKTSHSESKEAWLNFVYQPSRDVRGEVEGILVHVVDVTEQVLARKKVEEYAYYLAAERDSLRFMAESMPQKIFTARPDGSRDYFNAQWLEYSGLSAEQLAGLAWSALIHPEDRPGHLIAWRRSVETGEPFYYEYRLRNRDGDYRWHMARAFPKRDEEGTITLWIGSSTDVDDSRRSEEVHRERLEREVGLRTEELMRSNEQLQGFTYSVAHDLRQQIRGISSNSSLLLIDAADDLNEHSKEILRALESNAKRLGALVDDLLAYARLGRQEPKRVLLDLSSMAEEVAAYLKQSGRCRQETRIVIEPELTAPGDPTMVRLVLENLIDNACKYSAEVENPLIEVGRDGDSFFVRDNGIGFQMEYVGKLFQPFERLHRASEYSGTGIGLANVKRIVEKHGGRVQAFGKSGEGATFSFNLGPSESAKGLLI